MDSVFVVNIDSQTRQPHQAINDFIVFFDRSIRTNKVILKRSNIPKNPNDKSSTDILLRIEGMYDVQTQPNYTFRLGLGFNSVEQSFAVLGDRTLVTPRVTLLKEDGQPYDPGQDWSATVAFELVKQDISDIIKIPIPVLAAGGILGLYLFWNPKDLRKNKSGKLDPIHL